MTIFNQSTSTESLLRREVYKLKRENEKLKRQMCKAAVKIQKAKLPSLLMLKKRAWKVFSEWVRRQGEPVCFTCDKREDRWQSLHGGHFIDRSVCGVKLNYDTRNIKKQCLRCNYWKNGNKSEYRKRMVILHGEEAVCALEAEPRDFKPTREYFQEVIEKYKGLLKIMDGETVKSLPQETTFGGKNV